MTSEAVLTVANSALNIEESLLVLVTKKMEK